MKNCALIAIAILLFACGDDVEPQAFEVVKANFAENRVDLEQVTLSPGMKLSPLASSHIDFVKGLNYYQNTVPEKIAHDSSFASLQSNLRASYGGSPVFLDIISNNSSAKAMSFESLLAMTTFYQVHKIRDFAAQFWSEDQRKLLIALYPIVYDNSGTIALIIKDNALYTGNSDLMMIFSSARNSGLPFAMNPGILAHEYFHRIAFFSVWHNKNYPNLWQRYQEFFVRNKDNNKREQIILNSFEEGLADIFAVAYCESPDFFKLSIFDLDALTIRLQRDLDGYFANIASFDLLAADNFSSTLKLFCKSASKNYSNDDFNSYCLGTVLAKSLYDAAEKDIEKIKLVIIPSVLASLDLVSELIAAKHDFDPGLFLSYVQQEIMQRNVRMGQAYCRELKKRFTSLYVRGDFSGCP